MDREGGECVALGEPEQEQLPGSVPRGCLVQEVGRAGQAVTDGNGDRQGLPSWLPLQNRKARIGDPRRQGPFRASSGGHWQQLAAAY
ncbi:hypothetical protein [Streptomyces sp. AC555_RSS877]|uniref:hypothetical protein n=1 Tax=Streptomyces sp. AC555_RSS877 TaxID=2823688 RepID=UPI001C275114|nr:hypothetical protein [Streptomyces sp. AC555_RSS877]